MKKLSNYWVDKNNNKWNCNIYSQEEAKKYSKTLVNCSDCSDCSDCSGCRGCSDCSGCSGCRYCSGCSDCSDCIDCSYCRDCSGCRACIDCSDCIGCRGCRGCSDCSGCRENPQRYVTPKIGSRNDNTYYYFGKNVDQVVCGCYRGALKKFKDRVKFIYGKEKHGVDYMKQIKIMESLVKANI